MARRAFTFALVAMAFTVSSSLGAAEEPTVYRSKEGLFSLSLPAGWQEIPQKMIQERNALVPAAYHFACGFHSGKTKAITAPYLLIQIKHRAKESEDNLKTYRANAQALGDLADLATYIREKRYVTRPELYSKQYDAFILITEYPREKPLISVMVKKFCDYGYVLLHFYLGDNLDEDVSAISGVVASFRFEKENDATKKAE